MGFLFEHPDHGYELHHHLKEVFGNIWHASQSQTYNILKRLEAQGYISVTEVEQDKLPARQLQELTAEGRMRFTDWLNQPSKCSVHAIRVEFLTRLYFTQLFYPHQTQEIIRSQIEVVENGVDDMQGVLDALPTRQVFDRLAVELRIELLKSLVAWLKGCENRFTGMNSGE